MTLAKIRDCFRYAGLSIKVLLEEKNSNIENENDKQNLPVLFWLENHTVNICRRGVAKHFKSCDDEAYTSGTPTDDDIVFQVS